MYHIRIEMAANGFVVTYTDPGLYEKNRKSKDTYIDSDVRVVFESEEALATGISRLAPKLASAMAKENNFDKGIADALVETAEAE